LRATAVASRQLAPPGPLAQRSLLQFGALDTCARVRAAEEAGMEQAGRLDVVGKAILTAQQVPALDARSPHSYQ